MNYKLKSEDDSKFVVIKDGQEIVIAKKGLSKGLHDRIRKMAEGGTVDDLMAPDPQSIPQPVLEPLQPADPPPQEQPVDPRYQKAVVDANAKMDPSKWVLPTLSGTKPAAPDQTWGDEKTAPARPGNPAINTSELQITAKTPRQVDLSTEAPVAPPAPKAATRSGPPQKSEYDKLVDAGIEAAKAEAAVKEKIADTKVEYMQKRVQMFEDAHAKYKMEIEANQAKTDALMRDVLAQKIDPMRVYTNMDNAQRITSIIGLVLGGIGQALDTQGRGNVALAQIDKLIDRDIDAQKADLQNKHTLLGYYMAQGRDIREAYSLAKADIQDHTAALIDAQVARYGGAAAQAALAQKAVDIRTKAFETRRAMIAQDLANALTIEDIKLKHQTTVTQQAVLGMQRRVNDALYSLANGDGKSVNDQMLPAEDRKSIVVMPDGTKALARDPETARSVNDVFRTTNTLKNTLNEMKKFRGDEGRVWGKFGADNARANELLQNAITELSEWYGTKLSGLSQSEMETFKARLKDPGAIFTSDGSLNASIDQMLKQIDDKVLWTKKQYVSGMEHLQPNAPTKKKGNI